MGRLNKQAERKSPYMLLMMVVFLWGVNSVSIKYLTEFFPPLLLAAVRLLLAGSFLFGIFLLKNKKRKLPRPAWGATFGVAVFAIFLHQIALTVGLKATSSTHAILILGMGPLFTTVMACLFLREPFSLPRGLGLLLGLGGVILVVAGKSQTGASLLGDALIGAAALAFAIGALFVKKAVIHSSSLAVTAYSHFFAALGLGAAALCLQPPASAAIVFNSTVMGVLLFSSFMSTAVGALLWNMSIHQVGASTAALFQNASPIVGIFATALFLGEELIWQYFLSLCLVIGGVVLGAGILSLPDFTKKKV